MNHAADRPAPERLLAAANAASTNGRGRLKIFLGYAPGVGKTFAMLEAAKARMRDGVAVIAGVVLTHGRRETAVLLDGLELLPARRVVHGDTTVEEFDLAAALKRRPGLLLVDELAHTNAPGSRHAKRWQDVEELIAAGIDVATTLNVQHVESLHDVVQRLTGVDVRERIPDHLLDAADEIELVDLPPAELQERLRVGKIYLGEAAARALAGFFTAPILAGLRELALRLVADHVAGRQTSLPAAGRLLVCVGPSPFSARLLRATRGMADGLHVGWIALHVQTSVVVDSKASERVAQHLRLAERLGAQVMTEAGDDLAMTVVRAARRHGATRIVIGKPVAPGWRDRVFGSPVYELIRASGDIDVYVINGEGAVETVSAPVATSAVIDWVGMALAVLAVGAATAVGFLAQPWLAASNLVMLYLLVVLLVAFRGRRLPVVAASVIGILVFDFCFIPPVLAFTVADSQYLLTFLGMLTVGMVVSTLVSRLRAQTVAALAHVAEARALHQVGQQLASTRGTTALAESASRRCSEVLGSPVVVLPADGPEANSLAAAAVEFVHGDRPELPPAELAVAQWALEHDQLAGSGTDTLPGAVGLHVPLPGSRGPVGVLCCLGNHRGHDPARRHLIESLARLVGLAIDADRLAAMAQDARTAVDTERLRSTLLAAMSHDLRTPLAAIAGSASTLLSGTIDEVRSRALLITIHEQADRLARLVANLLQLTRLQSGSMAPVLVPVPVEDALGVARAAMGSRLDDHPLSVMIPDDCPPVSADEVLLQSALINLLDNAIQHTPSGTPIDISVITVERDVEIRVADRGPGLGTGDPQRLFAAFQRGQTASGTGAGLGLAIVRSVAELLHGSINARNRPGGGAEFALRLPLASMPHHD